MKTLTTINDCFLWRKQKNGFVGFVPTMGALHDGHLSLIKRSQSMCAFSVVSIYINPTQFAPGEDLELYPKTLDADLDHLNTLGVDAVFIPTDKEIYPDGSAGLNYQNQLFNKLEGKSRPHFFIGVTKVVSRLFDIIKPTHVFFGEKDAQQLRVIKQMIVDLKYNIDLIPCPTVRDEDGLALSSRNQYLSNNQQKTAACFYRSLMNVKYYLDQGERSSVKLKEHFKNDINTCADIKIDYISIACCITLNEQQELVAGDVLVSSAVFFKEVRLIDNFFYQSST